MRRCSYFFVVIAEDAYEKKNTPNKTEPRPHMMSLQTTKGKGCIRQRTRCPRLESWFFIASRTFIEVPLPGSVRSGEPSFNAEAGTRSRIQRMTGGMSSTERIGRNRGLIYMKHDEADDAYYPALEPTPRRTKRHGPVH